MRASGSAFLRRQAPPADFRVGKNFSSGVDTKSGFATRDSFGFRLCASLDVNIATMKFGGYDMRGVQAYRLVSAGFAEGAFLSASARAFNYVGTGPDERLSPFAPAARSASVSAGFDYRRHRQAFGRRVGQRGPDHRNRLALIAGDSLIAEGVRRRLPATPDAPGFGRGPLPI